ncbi:MAG: hypothetical protein QOJ79_694 [Actinomycetota bacterium]|jgi:hypothetical protein|nr:hypothetical protein [Actinomycetota bacterium]
MISKKKIAVGLAAAASIVLIGGSALSAGPASATDALACTVTGSVTVDGAGITNAVPGTATTGHFNSTTLSCKGTGAGNGDWNVGADFSSASENCAADAAGAGNFNGGSGPGGLSVSGGHFDFTRVGTAVHVRGNVNTSAGNYAFVASLVFLPSNGVCANPALNSGGTTAADIAAGSTAVVYQL